MSSNEAPGDAVQIGAGTDQSNAVTGGIISLALGLAALMGGGTLATAFQYWSFEIMARGMDSDPGWFAQSASALPPILLGIMAIGVGVAAARSPHIVASATGKAGIALGLLAALSGVVLAVSLHQTQIFS